MYVRPVHTIDVTVDGLTCTRPIPHFLFDLLALSFMVLATLTPVTGLVTASLFPLPYALFATSRHMNVGAVSLVGGLNKRMHTYV